MIRTVGADDDLIRGNTVTYKHRVGLQVIAQALEDLPADARDQAAEIASAPPNVSLRHRIVDELENAVLDAYGNLERAPLLHFLSQYPVRPYTYEVSAVLSRGERPTPQKLLDLVDHGHYQATINLCAEMAAGDDPIISQAGLAGRLRTYHLPVVDMGQPELAQVAAFLGIVSMPAARRTYLHCEAGMGRTGVLTACYRLAIMGWCGADALTEAGNFGCSVPMQLAFIEKFAALLGAQHQARADGRLLPASQLSEYPVLAPGSVRPTARQLTATVASVSRAEAGDIR